MTQAQKVDVIAAVDAYLRFRATFDALSEEDQALVEKLVFSDLMLRGHHPTEVEA